MVDHGGAFHYQTADARVQVLARESSLVTWRTLTPTTDGSAMSFALKATSSSGRIAFEDSVGN
jgi:hypothetical protein